MQCPCMKVCEQTGWCTIGIFQTECGVYQICIEIVS